MDRSKHRITKYFNDEKTNKAIIDSVFKRLNPVDKDLYEVKSKKSAIEHRELIIVGFFILSLQNGDCWSFTITFLTSSVM